jgi:hypothetical protein
LVKNNHFPYTSQPFSRIHKSEKFFESRHLFAVYSLVGLRGLDVSLPK